VRQAAVVQTGRHEHDLETLHQAFAGWVGQGRIWRIDALAIVAASEDEVRRFERHAHEVIAEQDLYLSTAVHRRETRGRPWRRITAQDPPPTDEEIERELLRRSEGRPPTAWTYDDAEEWSRDLAEWFRERFAAEWAHPHAATIEQDGDGWWVEVDLAGTDLDDGPFEPVAVGRTADDWLEARVDDGCWRARCGPDNLEEALAAFLAWSSQPRP
jgi:hypothetical protein